MSTDAIFPTQYSLLSTKALNSYISKAYSFQNCQTKLIIHGVSDTYKVTTQNGDFILKLYRSVHRSEQELLGELEMLNILHQKGARVAFPVSDQEGKQIQRFQAVEGVRYGVVFQYAKGKALYDFTEEQLRLIGREMAKVHTITSAVKLNYPRKAYTIDTTFTQPIETLKPAFDELPKEYEYLKSTGESIIKELAALDTTSFSVGYCHYDFLPKNFHFDEKGQVTFFDFDFLGKGFLVNDVMSFIMHYFFHTYFKGMDTQEAKNCINTFIEGYREVRSLSDEELAIVPHLGFLFWTFYLGFQYENFEDWSNFFFNTRYLKDRTNLIQKWMEW